MFLRYEVEQRQLLVEVFGLVDVWVGCCMRVADKSLSMCADDLLIADIINQVQNHYSPFGMAVQMPCRILVHKTSSMEVCRETPTYELTQ